MAAPPSKPPQSSYGSYGSYSPSGVWNSIGAFGSGAASRAKQPLDRAFPPEQRASLLAATQAFVLSYPKLSAFLAVNVALTGIPLGIFVFFALSVGISSLVISVILALFAATLITVFAVGVALIFLLPTIFFTTTVASCLFVWGLVAFYVFCWISGQDPSEPVIAEQLNRLTGGRLTGFVDAAKGERGTRVDDGVVKVTALDDKHANGFAQA